MNGPDATPARVAPFDSGAPKLETHRTGVGNSMLQRLRGAIKRQEFQPGALGILVNPFYIIRKGLYDAVRDTAPRMSGSVLDFGCGSKPYENLFTNAAEYIGLDIEVSGHDHQSSKVDVYYDGNTIPFDAARFDAVVAFEVFEHVFEIDRILQEIRRVVRPGGTLFFTIPFIWDEHEQPYDFGRYTSFGTEAVLRRNGFTNVRVRKTTSYFRAASQLMIAYVYQHVFPRNPRVKRVLGMVLVAPAVAVTILADKILPRSHDCYCNLAVTCERDVDTGEVG